MVWRGETQGHIWVRPKYPFAWETWVELNITARWSLQNPRQAGSHAMAGLGHSTHTPVSKHGMGHARLGCSTHHNVREPDMGGRFCRRILWVCLCGIATPASLYRRLKVVMGHLTGTHLTFVGAGLGRGQGGMAAAPASAYKGWTESRASQ